MRNIEVRPFKIGSEQTALDGLLLAARLEERHSRAEVMAARLEKLAVFITKSQLNGTEAAELLRVEAAIILNEAGELQ